MKRTSIYAVAILAIFTVFIGWLAQRSIGDRPLGSARLAGSASALLPALDGNKAVAHLKQEGLYASLHEAMAAARYQVEQEGAAYQVANPAQGFRARFTREGLQIADARSSQWQLGMKLTGYGYGDTAIEVEPGELRASANRIEIEHLSSGGQRATITEWYINKAEGLEQGFTIAERPGEGSQGEWLSVRLELEGDLRGEIVEGEQAMRLRQGGDVLRYEKLVAWDAMGRELAVRMRLWGREVRLEVEDEGAVYPVTIDPLFSQQAKLTAIDGAPDDYFGASIAISGETALVGVPGDNLTPFTKEGSAYIFVRSGTSWSQQAKLTASDGGFFDHFGSSVGISGETAVIGAPGNPARNAAQGSAYVFVRSGTTWSQQTKLTASDGTEDDRFGDSVAIGGATVLIGASGDDIGANNNQGSAYVFVRAGTNWSQQAKLTASDGGTNDRFGRSVAIGGETAMVGAFLDDVGANDNQGSAYVFVRVGTSWSQQVKLTASDGAASDRFGTSIAISGETVVVGAPGNAGNSSNVYGSAYIFARTGTSWNQQTKLTAGDGEADDGFGQSVSISGETVVIGAFLDNVGTNTVRGSAFAFVRSGTTWSQQRRLTASESAFLDGFGFSVALDGETIVIGAPLLQDDAGPGSAYVFTCGETPMWSEQARKTAGDGVAGDRLGTSIAISGETAVVGASGDDVGANNDQGSVYVFVRVGTGWSQQAKLTAGDGTTFDGFGISVAISGETVVVGAFTDTVGTNGIQQGSAYVFVRSGVRWGQQAKLIASDGAAEDLFGFSVSISGETVVVGAWQDDVGASTDRGSAYVFVRSGKNWNQQAKLTASDGAAFDGLGISVAITGETAVVGAFGDANGRGAAYVFARAGTSWSQQAKLTADDGAASDQFGRSVGISGETALVGANADDVGIHDFQGSAYVFVRSGTSWSQQAKLTASDGETSDRFGQSVSISGETVVIGASGDDIGANNAQGSAYIFVRAGSSWSQQVKLTASDAAATDNFGAAVAISGKTVAVGANVDDVGANSNQGSAYFFTGACGQAANRPPDSGINQPADGSSRVGELQQFVTTCSDPDGWRDIHTIDFKIAKGEGQGTGELIALWLQFDEDENLIRFYDPDTQTWSEGKPGQNLVLSSRFADLYLINTLVQGSGPTGASVQIVWGVVFKGAAVRNNYKQFLRIEDDAGLSTETDRVGRWSVTP